MKTATTFLILVGLLIGLLNLACKKFIEIDPPTTQAELSKIFADDQTATSAVVGVYTQMVSGALLPFNGGITIYAGLSADELKTTASGGTIDPFGANILLATNSTVSTLWLTPYKHIYQANACLEGIAGSSTLSLSVNRQLRGEMLYIRALNYFYLINLFGAVPLETKSDYVFNASLPRTNITDVYRQIISDLKEAKTLLSSVTVLPNTRPTRYSVAALLARIYLYTSDYEAAEEMASEVIGSGKFGMEAPANVFLSGSRETIFQISKSNGNVSEAITFIPATATARPAYILSNELLGSFEAGDTRKNNWTKNAIISGVTYSYPYKYKVRVATPITEFLIVQRLSELYLIRAEARAQLGNLPAALDDLDIIRGRASLTLLKNTNPSISQTALLNAVLKERQVEFFAEWANRWLDLKRTGKADIVLTSVKGSNWQPTDKLYPIPFTQLQANPFLTQNEGYPN